MISGLDVKTELLVAGKAKLAVITLLTVSSWVTVIAPGLFLFVKNLLNTDFQLYALM